MKTSRQWLRFAKRNPGLVDPSRAETRRQATRWDKFARKTVRALRDVSAGRVGAVQRAAEAHRVLVHIHHQNYQGIEECQTL